MTAEPKRQQPRIARAYRTATVVFLIIALIAIGGVSVLAFSSTTIVVHLTARTIRQTADVALGATSKPEENLAAGSIVPATAQGEQAITVPSSSSATVEDHARGTVTIVNHWTKTQPLAAGTRLQAADGSIVRTEQRVDVPAGGSVSVGVVADALGQSGNLPASRFDIVALWPGLKQQIYAESTAALTGGVRTDAVVTAELIDSSKKALETSLAQQAQPTVPEGMTVVGSLVVASSTVTASVTAGSHAGTFTVHGSVRLLVAAVRTQDVQDVVNSLLQQALRTDEQFTAQDPTVTWTVSDASERSNTARLQLTAERTASLKTSSDRFQSSHFTAMSKEDIQKALQGTEGIGTVSITMRPSWSNRTPSLARQIKVQVIPAS